MDSLLPPNATQLELNIERSIAGRLDIAVTLKNNRNADLVEVQLLPYLAQDLSVDYWQDDWSEGKKRTSIKVSTDLHQVKGTVYAVKTAIEQITQDYQIIEWFYQSTLPLTLPDVLMSGSGLPNTVEINLSVDSSAVTTKEVIAAVNNAKPLHVHTTVSISQSADIELSFIAAGYCETHTSVYGLAA